MNHTLPDRQLSQLSEMIAAKTALHFPKERWNDLEYKIISAAKEFGFTGMEEFIQWLLSSPLTADQMDILVSHLTIHETYFWREPQVFEAIATRILPEIVCSRKYEGKRLRIWSAGCATGEEPYSIAIALSRTIPVMEDWNITILATDINPRILRKAMAGVYSKWSLRNAPQWLIEGYFHRKKEGVFEIIPEIRKMVAFAYLNLADDVYPAPLNNTNAMDIIFCRNVLMYFAPERARQVGQGLFRSLVDGGWLMVGASELSQQIFPSFKPINFNGAIVYRKGNMESQTSDVFTTDESLLKTETIQPILKANDELDQKSPHGKEYSTVIEQPPQAASPRMAGKIAEESIRSFADRGKLPEALFLCEEAIAYDKLDPGLYYLRAIILLELNRLDEAGVSLKQTLYLDQNFLLAHFALGNIVMRQGKATAAKKHFENVLTLLKDYKADEIFPESEGLTAGRFREIIQATMETGALA